MTRVTSSQWLKAGLKVLETEGFTGLKADRMVKKLGVTRGSFYWHFENVAAYHAALVDSWATLTFDAAKDLAKAPSAKDGLLLLIKAAGGSNHALERAVRVWARSDPLVGTKVDEVDRFRLSTLETLFTQVGFPPAEAAFRAKLLFASAIGHSVVDKKVSMDPQELERLAMFIVQKSEE
ncbi:MAG: TetR/AcrR family transcriptional regulator [Pseudomonadota bacterium]